MARKIGQDWLTVQELMEKAARKGGYFCLLELQESKIETLKSEGFTVEVFNRYKGGIRDAIISWENLGVSKNCEAKRLYVLAFSVRKKRTKMGFNLQKRE